MIPLLTYPLALLALAALPTLAAIYLLRNRFRRQTVSSLLLWPREARPKEGGPKVQSLRVPWIFFLELFILALLALAAAGPRWPMAETSRPLVVVLDDSMSMRARSGAGSPRDQALPRLEALLDHRRHPSIRFILAGPRPQAAGPAVTTSAEARAALKSWTCLAATAALDEALTLAADMAGPRADLLVVTDHAPASSLTKGRVVWWAFGQPQPNAAFTQATRTPHGDQDRVLLEIAAFPPAPPSTPLEIRCGDQLLKRSALALAAGTPQRLVFNLPAGAPPLVATLGSDALDTDNRVDLLPSPRPRVRIQVEVGDEPLRNLVLDAINATGLRATTPGHAELVITENLRAPAGSNRWNLRILTAERPTAYTGPFVVNPAHPLLEGANLEGVIWAAGLPRLSNTIPVITAGNVPLLALREDTPSFKAIDLQYAPAFSSLHTTPNWPILWWNLLSWRAREKPGLTEINHRLGGEIVFQSDGAPARWINPDGAARDFPALENRLILQPDIPGLHRLEQGSHSYAFAVNPLAPEESDLTQARGGEWGAWEHEAGQRFEYAAALWIFLLAALALLTWHQFVLTGLKKATP